MDSRFSEIFGNEILLNGREVRKIGSKVSVLLCREYGNQQLTVQKIRFSVAYHWLSKSSVAYIFYTAPLRPK